MDLLAFQLDKLRQAAVSLLSPDSMFSVPQLAVAFAIAFAYLVFRQRRRRGTLKLAAILRAMAPRRILGSRSTKADLFYYLVNTFAVGGLIGWGILSSLTVMDSAVGILRAGFGAGAPSAAPEWALRTGMTLVVFLAYELAYYLDHYLKHRIPILWEFHKVHHTADVVTPLTLFRVHPIDSLIFVDIIAVITGLAQGIFIYLAGESVSMYSVGASNILTVGFFFLLAHLQHSQFWMPLTGLPGRLLLSPAHHQLHHSANPAHFNCNLGSGLAIWDWLFGTLSIPSRESPRLKFGVAEPADDPHSITGLLIAPVVKALGIVDRIARPGAADGRALSP
jgi:sterol desaturase/sphingolipid hydroxylase (fatty acid hydroxylase superfamily)